MMTATQPSLGFVGAGKVGRTLARLWSACGYTVGAVYSRTPERASLLAAESGARLVSSPGVVLAAADLVFLTVPDDQLAGLARTLVMGDLAGKAVVHTSGALDAAVLEPLARQGAMTGSLHPAFPFADVDLAVERLPGATFALEAVDATLDAWLTALVACVGGRVLPVPAGGKALYHAALVLASNYTVTLYAVAESLLVGLGASREAAGGALDALVGGTVANLRLRGVPDALTGPLTRADVGAVDAHLRALAAVDGRLEYLYRLLAELSLPMLAARGIHAEAIVALLGVSAKDKE